MIWAATQAKAKFSEVLDKAETEGPQVMRRRKHEFVLMKKEDYDALPKESGPDSGKGQQSLVAFFRTSPAYGLNATFRRLDLRARKVKF
jgi:prevent-host-death family protein